MTNLLTQFKKGKVYRGKGARAKPQNKGVQLNHHKAEINNGI